jgi:hypothetical protein
MADDLIQDLLKTYNNLDERIGGVLPGGAATRILGTQAVLNSKPVRWDGKDWVSPEDFNKRNESKVGYSQAQPIRDKLNQIVSNPVVNTGLQISHTALQRGGGFTFQKLPFINKSPMDMLGKVSGLITEGISDATNVDPLPIDIALAALPVTKAGLLKGFSKLGRVRIPGTRGGTFLSRNRLSIGAKATPHKRLNTLMGEAIDLVTEGVMPQSLKGLKFGPALDTAVNTISAVIASGKVPGGSITDHRMSKLITPEGVTAIYGTKKLGKRVLGSDAHGGMSKPVFHHIIGKKIRYRFQQKMQQFDPQGGKGRLEALDKKYNLEAGSGDNAGLSMDTGAHGAHHDTSRVAGIEPWDTKAGKTLSKLKGLIDNAKTIEELEYLYDLYLKHSVIPDLDKAIKYQRGYEILGSPTVVDKNLLSKTADEWGTRMKDINEVRATEAQRQMGEYDAVADELKQLNSNRYNAF